MDRQTFAHLTRERRNLASASDLELARLQRVHEAWTKAIDRSPLPPETELKEFERKWNAGVASHAAIESKLAAVESRLQGHRANLEHGLELSEDSAVFVRWLRRGMNGLTSAEERALQEFRAFSLTAGNAGLYSAPQAFADKLEIALKAGSSIFAVATIAPTERGGAAPFPTLNYTGVSGAITTEGAGPSTDASTPFGVITMNSYTYRSKLLPVSFEYLDDQAFGEDFLVRALTDSLRRAANAHFTTGSGSSQPTGLVTAATVGKVGTVGQTATVIYDDLVDLVDAVDPDYLEPAEGAVLGWMMSPASLKIVRKLKDSAGNPIVTNDPTGTAPRPMLLGHPVYRNPDMPAMAANAKPIAFGRLDKYTIRQSSAPIVLRSEERFAENGQVAFQVAERWDGNIIDAGTHPIVVYQNSAT